MFANNELARAEKYKYVYSAVLLQWSSPCLSVEFYWPTGWRESHTGMVLLFSRPIIMSSRRASIDEVHSRVWKIISRWFNTNMRFVFRILQRTAPKIEKRSARDVQENVRLGVWTKRVRVFGLLRRIGTILYKRQIKFGRRDGFVFQHIVPENVHRTE